MSIFIDTGVILSSFITNSGIIISDTVPPVENEYLAVGFHSSPYIHIHKFDSITGFGTLSANPTEALTGAVTGIAYKSNALILGHYNSPFVSAYSFIKGELGSKYANPTVLPSGNSFGMCLNNSGNALVLGSTITPYISAYAWNDGFGTKYSDPSVLPPDTVKSTCFNNDDSTVVVGHYDSPFISAYAWNNGFGTKYANPSTLPPNIVNSARFSYAGDCIALAHATTPTLSAYAWNAGFGTKYTNPSTLPYSLAVGQAITFSKTDDSVFLGMTDSPFAIAYKFNSATGFGTKYTDPSTSLPGACYGTISLNNNDSAIAIPSFSSPFINVYAWNAGFGTKYANPSTLPDSYVHSSLFFKAS